MIFELRALVWAIGMQGFYTKNLIWQNTKWGKETIVGFIYTARTPKRASLIRLALDDRQ